MAAGWRHHRLRQVVEQGGRLLAVAEAALEAKGKQ
jgi:hypothetical protein